MTDRNQVIRNTVNELIERDYRTGFEDTVLHRVCSALNEFDGSGQDFWNAMLIGRIDRAMEEFFYFDINLFELYEYAERMSKGPGCFVMDPRDLGS